jgi:hypothetical protein
MCRPEMSCFRKVRTTRADGWPTAARTAAITPSSHFELRFDVLNVFDNINFNPVANPGTGATIFQTGSAYTDLSNTFDPGGRLGMLVFRLNW